MSAQKRVQEALEAAVEFVAWQIAGPERILTRHYPSPRGTCAGCTTTPVRYPCSVARIAELAQEHPVYRARTARVIRPPGASDTTRQPETSASRSDQPSTQAASLAAPERPVPATTGSTS